MINKLIFKHYAIGFHDLGIETLKSKIFYDDLKLIKNVFKETPMFSKYLGSNDVLKTDKFDLIDKAFKENIDQYSLNFFKILVSDYLIDYFSKIYNEYHHLMNIEIGIIEGKLYCPFSLEETQIKTLEDIFTKKLNKKVEFKLILDQRLIGGIKILVDSTLYEYTISSMMDSIKNKLLYD
ncbi:MAG: ATP synthase F1 subunit delta [Bacilli bacterium]